MKLIDSPFGHTGLIATSARTLPPFHLVRVQSTGDVVAALADAARPAILAGGTDLPACFNEGFEPSHLIDISRLDALRNITVQDNALHIGALVTHAAGADDALIQQHVPGFSTAWKHLANVRIRLRATLGGNLMARRARYEGAILLCALDARLRFATGGAALEMTVAEFINAAPADTPARFLTGIVIPLRRGLRLDYDRSLRPVMTQAVALAGDGYARAVLATEYIQPQVLDLDADPMTAHDKLPPELGDPVTSSSYLRHTGRVLLRRQLARMATA